MKKIISYIAVGLLTQQIAVAQGTTTYLSNLGQQSTGSISVGSNSWVAAVFNTGTAAGGYILNSIQLGMADATGSPSGLTVMLFGNGGFPAGIYPGSSLGTLIGASHPQTSGIYAYAPAAILTLAPSTVYFIVATAATAITNGAYGWITMNTRSYGPVDGWSGNDAFLSGDGSHWAVSRGAFPQYAVNATAVPEPSCGILVGLGGLLGIWCRRKAKAAL